MLPADLTALAADSIELSSPGSFAARKSGNKLKVR
jgi:hypothetical protein